LLLDNPKYTKAILSRSLSFSFESWYYHSRLERPDKELSNQILDLHQDIDDTLGHKKLAPLLNVNKKRIHRVMKKYGMLPGSEVKGITTMVNQPLLNQTLPTNQK